MAAGTMSHAEYSKTPRVPIRTPRTLSESSDDREATIGGIARAAARMGEGGRGSMRAPAELQSWPGIVHGGAAVALLDAAVGLSGPRIVEGRLTSSLPLESDLDLDAEPFETGTTVIVRRDGLVLTSATIRPADVASLSPAAWRGGTRGRALPMSDDCLACGAGNPVGLRIELSFDETGVWARFVPGAAWRAGDEALHPALFPVALDEVAWWLGALVAQDGGLTNRICVTFTGSPGRWGEPVVAAGRFEDVTPIDRRRAFWRTETAIAAADGEVLASASIVFRGGPEYSSLQIPYFRSRTAPEVFRRMFPNHA